MPGLGLTLSLGSSRNQNLLGGDSARAYFTLQTQNGEWYAVRTEDGVTLSADQEEAAAGSRQYMVVEDRDNPGDHYKLGVFETTGASGQKLIVVDYGEPTEEALTSRKIKLAGNTYLIGLFRDGDDNLQLDLTLQ